MASMKVPQLQRSVDVQPQGISEPKIPMAPDAAFGGDVARATAGLGTAGVEAANTALTHIQRERYYQEQEQGDEWGVKFSNALTSKVNSVEPKTITTYDEDHNPTGTYDIPDGFLNRQRTQAAGVSKEYFQYVEGLKSDYLKQIKNPNVQRRFLENIDTYVRTYGNKIIEHETKQYNEASKDNINNWTQTGLQSYPLMTSEDKLKFVSNFNSKINAAYQRGLFTFDEAQKKKNDFDEYLFYENMPNNPKETIDELAKGQEGIYKNLDPKQRDKFVNEANQVLQRQQVEAKAMRIQAQNKAENALVDKRIAGTLTLNEIKTLRDTGAINSKFADSMMISMFSPKAVKAVTNPVVYQGIMDMLMDNKTKASEINNAILEAQGNGTLSTSDAHSLFYTKQQGRDTSVYQDYYDETHKAAPAWQTAFNAIKDAAIKLYGGGASPITNMQLMLINALKGSNANAEQIQETTNKVIKQNILKVRPDIATHDEKKGQLMVDDNGNKAIVYPDGRIEEVK